MGSPCPKVGAVLLTLLAIALTGCGDGADHESAAANSASAGVEKVTIEEYLYEAVGRLRHRHDQRGRNG